DRLRLGLAIAQSRLYGATILMSEHDEQLGVEVKSSILDASQDLSAHNISRNARDEYISETPIEHDLRPDARVAAPKDRGKRMLSSGEFLYAAKILMLALEFAGGEAQIAVLQSLQRRLGCNRRDLRITGPRNRRRDRIRAGSAR